MRAAAISGANEAGTPAVLPDRFWVDFSILTVYTNDLNLLQF